MNNKWERDLPMQCGSRFSVIRCVKTYRLQTTSPSTIEFFQLRTAASGLPHMRDMQMSQTQRDFTQLLRCERISFLDRNRPTLRRLSALGHDLGPRSGDWCTGAHNPKSADIIGPSGMAMIAVVTNCCEITA
jgi:hypothetical protein